MSKTTTFKASEYDGPAGPVNGRPIITTIRLEEGPGHDRLHVWNRGGKAGELVVELGDGKELVHRLFGLHSYAILEVPD